MGIIDTRGNTVILLMTQHILSLPIVCFGIFYNNQDNSLDEMVINDHENPLDQIMDLNIMYGHR